jgi:hypothetical protein
MYVIQILPVHSIQLFAFNNRENSLLNQNGGFNVIPMEKKLPESTITTEKA